MEPYASVVLVNLVRVRGVLLWHPVCPHLGRLAPLPPTQVCVLVGVATGVYGLEVIQGSQGGDAGVQRRTRFYI